MKHISLALAAALAAAVPFAVAPEDAAAAAHQRVTPLDCRALAARVGAGNVWQASFAGTRGGRGTWNIFERTYSAPCFRTLATCVDWLYWQQSDWPNDNNVGRCRRGMPYGVW